MRYERPHSLDMALGFLAADAGRVAVLAGGTDLIVQMQAAVRQPDLVIDIKAIPELMAITERDGGFEIGAGVSGGRLLDHPGLNAAWPGLIEATSLIGSTQIKSRATLVGNLCNGSPAADSVPALIAADAVATVMGPMGTRRVPVEDIPVGPGKTSLGSGEIIVSLRLPARATRSSDCYLRMTPRTEMDIAVVGAGVSLTFDSAGLCIEARVAIGAVAPTARLVPDAGSVLVGTRVDDVAVRAAMAAASAAARPIDDKRGSVDYRIKTIGVLVGRAIRIAHSRAIARKDAP